jgi:hypothetical protein
VDGLIEVDLHRLRPKKRERYLTPQGAVKRENRVAEAVE